MFTSGVTALSFGVAGSPNVVPVSDGSSSPGGCWRSCAEVSMSGSRPDTGRRLCWPSSPLHDSKPQLHRSGRRCDPGGPFGCARGRGHCYEQQRQRELHDIRGVTSRAAPRRALHAFARAAPRRRGYPTVHLSGTNFGTF